MKSLRITDVLFWLALIAATCGCNNSHVHLNASASKGVQIVASAQASKIHLMIQDASGAVVYDDSKLNSALILKSGVPYFINLTATNFPSDTVFTLSQTEISVVAQPVTTLSLKEGTTPFQVATPGDYSWQLIATSSGTEVARNLYDASVSCLNPTLTAKSLNASVVTVVPGSSANLYNFSAAGVVSAGQGTPPFMCAWDPTGSAIRDTPFTDCSNTLKDFYSNYVGHRNVGLIVKDACNSPVTLSTSLNLSFNSPTAPGLFIFAQTSAAKGAAIGDPRLDGVTYLATNANAFVVDAQYAFGNFQINSTMKYNVSTSTPFGMQIQVRGIKDNVKLSSLQGGFDMTSASIRAVTYSTDEAGDHSVAVSLKGSNCTLSGQAAVVTFVPGSPCPNGYTGDQNKATVNISGHFSCIDVSDNSQSINIDGDFSGSTAMADFCAVVITAPAGGGASAGASSGGGTGGPAPSFGGGGSAGGGSAPAGPPSGGGTLSPVKL